jgi:thiol reductant ABC exporter CydC subunit
MSGAPELLALGATQERLDELARLDRDLAHAEARASTGGGLGTLVAGLAGGATTWFVLLAGVTALRAGSLEGVALAVVVLTPLAVHEIVAGLVPAAGHLPGLAASATRLDAVLQRPDPVRDPATPRPLPDGPYGLRLRRLRTRYGAGGPELLGGLDLDLPAGGRALLTGPSGSGKSTLAALLMRFLDPSAGSIELVGSRADVDLGDLAADDARSVIGLCAQDAHVFDTTVLENLRLARPDATPEQIRSALRGAQLQYWAESLPSGLDTLVGEHGARLSGGQRQRLALARVLLAERPVLVLDEPTEHLDEPTAQAFVADLLEAAQGRTLLVLTHRPELFEAAGTWPVRVDLVPATAEPADDPLSGSSAALAGPAAPWPSAPWPGPPSPSAPSRGA